MDWLGLVLPAGDLGLRFQLLVHVVEPVAVAASGVGWVVGSSPPVLPPLVGAVGRAGRGKAGSVPRRCAGGSDARGCPSQPLDEQPFQSE